MLTDMKAIAVTRSETRQGNPMWTLQTAGGDRINVFDVVRLGKCEQRYKEWRSVSPSSRRRSGALMGTARAKPSPFPTVHHQAADNLIDYEGHLPISYDHIRVLFCCSVNVSHR